ncbi:hypothetical protein K8W59_17730 [Nocardioides rotundus]|uniref:DUF2231 domain-containing protein n=1 Tax=Nocardioides rotundus TaxID=1774216 RepID=UPI001CBE3495|nr:DUF2231 domain-containing protein [Nocardioides rotundus]UAL29564.1 hypothetical protein K8W59_17730 [Nocardioides rotundus]
MFDTIGGLPLHPLVIHAVVVLGPLAGILLMAYVLMPRWRGGLRWPTLGLAAVAAVSAWVAEQSGEALEARIGEPRLGHADAGELAVKALYVLLAVTAVVVLLLLRPGAQRGAAGMLAVGLAVLAAGFAGYAVFDAGHSGASSVWLPRIANTTGGDG